MHVEHVLEMTTSLFSEQWRGKIVFSFMEISIFPRHWRAAVREVGVSVSQTNIARTLT